MEAPTSHRDAAAEAQETRERILDAAQKLFSEKGLEATSVRDITTEAGCNVAAVNYHFGGKDNLYVESFRAMLGPLRDRRLTMIDELMRREPAPTVEEFLTGFAEGFLEPLVDESLGRRFMLFVGREISDQKLPEGLFLDEFIVPLVTRAVAALDRVGFAMTPEQSFFCIFSLIGQLLHAVRGHHMSDQLELVGAATFDLRGFIDHFVRFSAAGIRACAMDDTATPAPFIGGEIHT